VQIFFYPKQLLANILTIYVQIFQADLSNDFVKGIAADVSSYRPEYFVEALRIAAELGLPGFSANACTALRQLAEAANVAHQEQSVRPFALLLAIFVAAFLFIVALSSRAGGSGFTRA
jgi:hypothetical protein